MWMIFLFIWGLALLWYLGSVADSIPWRSPWTYVILLFFVIIPLDLTGLIIPCILAGIAAWYFSPSQAMRREYSRREQIRANVWSHKRIEVEERKYLRRQSIREQTYERVLRQKQKCSAVYQQIQAKKTQRNNISSQMTNLYNVAITLGNCADHGDR